MHKPLTVLDVVLVFLLLEIIKETVIYILWKKSQEHHKVVSVTGTQLKDFLRKLEEENGEKEDDR